MSVVVGMQTGMSATVHADVQQGAVPATVNAVRSDDEQIVGGSVRGTGS